MQPPKVLLADDEKAFVETMTKRIQRRDIDVVSAHDGQQVLDRLAAADDIEVVVLDIKMPVMDGMQALKQIKGNHPLVEVIMLTGHGTVETGIEGMKLGAFDYLMKPCNLDELVSKIKAAADHKRAHEEKIREARVQAITLRRP